jgi:hypothetical protein
VNRRNLLAALAAVPVVPNVAKHAATVELTINGRMHDPRSYQEAQRLTEGLAAAIDRASATRSPYLWSYEELEHLLAAINQARTEAR